MGLVEVVRAHGLEIAYERTGERVPLVLVHVYNAMIDRRPTLIARWWPIKDRGSGEGYVLILGATTGTDSYGVGDFWAVRHRSGQIDDRALADDTRAHLDSFVNGDALVGTNVVVWYAAHFTHDVTDQHDDGNHVVGPTLRPDRW